MAVIVRSRQCQLLVYREDLVFHRKTRNRDMPSKRQRRSDDSRELNLQLALVKFLEIVRKQCREGVQTLALSQAVITIAVAR